MNTDTPTPETDALIATDQHHLEDDNFFPATVYWRMCDLSRRLERERDELAERLDFQRNLNRECIDQITSRTKERDEARDRADTMFANHADILDQARRERDEAREQLAAERELADRLALALKMTRWDSPVTCKKALTAWKEARRES